MKKYIIIVLVTSIFLASFPFAVKNVNATEVSIKDFIRLLITLGIIQPDKMAALNNFLINLDNGATNYIPQGVPNTVSGIKGKIIGVYSVGNYPNGITFDAQGNVWVTNTEPYDFIVGTISKLNGITGEVIGTYSTGGNRPWGVTVDKKGYVWVTNQSSNSISKLNGMTGELVGTYTLDNAQLPYDITVDNAGNVWVANYLSNNVSKINSLTGETIGTYNTETFPITLTVDNRGLVLVANYISDSISVFNATTTVLADTLKVDRSPTGIAVDKSNNIWVANNNSNTVSKLNGNTGSLIGTYPVGEQPEGLTVDINGDVWVSIYGLDYNSDSNIKGIYVLNGSTGVITNKYTSGGKWPTKIATDPYGNIWVVNSQSNTVTKLKGF